MNDALFETIDASDRPLVICDIDEVVLEFLDPLHEFLATVDHRLHADSFRLTGNIRRISDGVAAASEVVDAFEEAFYVDQNRWQRPVSGAVATLAQLQAGADVVFLTAMPPRHQSIRRMLLDRHGLCYPMIATEEAKGPVAARLIGNRGKRAVFIDDICTNLHSVRTHAPSCLLINMMANEIFRAMAPDPGESVIKARDWTHAGTMIRQHFGQVG